MATNRIDILDPALLRPGRIDRKVEFPAPSVDARVDILKIHSKKMNLVRNINLKVVRPKVLETTALGAALLAGYQVGEFKSLNEIHIKSKKDRVFSPKLHKSLRNNLLQGWKQAIRKTLA